MSKETQTIKIKYLPGAHELEKIVKGDWIDLYTYEDTTIAKGEYKMISLGVAMELPVGFEALGAPRSSTFKHWGLLQTNSIMVIDNSFCGDGDIWHYPVLATHDVVIPKGTRLCQFRIIENQPEIHFETVEHLSENSRGGFGSTGQ